MVLRLGPRVSNPGLHVCWAKHCTFTPEPLRSDLMLYTVWILNCPGLIGVLRAHEQREKRKQRHLLAAHSGTYVGELSAFPSQILCSFNAPQECWGHTKAGTWTVPPTWQGRVKALRLLFDLEGLFNSRASLSVSEFLGTQSAIKCILDMFGVCQVLCWSVETIQKPASCPQGPHSWLETVCCQMFHED